MDATIVITSQNSHLLSLCLLFLPPDSQILVVDGRRGYTGMRLIRYVVENVHTSHAILLDEDAFIFDFKRLEQLFEWCKVNRVACMGMPDGGAVQIRHHNPNAMNTFFNILDLDQIRARWSFDDCQAHVSTGQAMRTLWPSRDVIATDDWLFDDFETYYCFYFWLKDVGFNLKWLAAETHSDRISTLLKDHLGIPFLLHTWYARAFVRNASQRSRIVQAAHWAAGRSKTWTTKATFSIVTPLGWYQPREAQGKVDSSPSV